MATTRNVGRQRPRGDEKARIEACCPSLRGAAHRRGDRWQSTKRSRHKRVIGLVAAVVGLSLTGLVGGTSPAGAAARPSANGLCGAENMVNPNAFPHMVRLWISTPLSRETTACARRCASPPVPPPHNRRTRVGGAPDIRVRALGSRASCCKERSRPTTPPAVRTAPAWRASQPSGRRFRNADGGLPPRRGGSGAVRGSRTPEPHRRELLRGGSERLFFVGRDAAQHIRDQGTSDPEAAVWLPGHALAVAFGTAARRCRRSPF